jgi:uncharacterized protein YvpB
MYQNLLSYVAALANVLVNVALPFVHLRNLGRSAVLVVVVGWLSTSPAGAFPPQYLDDTFGAADQLGAVSGYQLAAENKDTVPTTVRILEDEPPAPNFSPTPTPLPQQVLVEGISRARQSRNLSCESRAAASLADYYGVPIEEMAFFAALPKSDNPDRGFVGDVDAPPGSLPPVGYGVYAEPVAATLREFDFCTQAWEYWGLDSLRAELADGRPVIVWATYDLRDAPIYEYTASDGTTAYAIPGQHVFIAAGYDASGVLLIDVYDGALKHFSYEAFEVAWSRFEQMAVTACAENAEE